MSATYARLPGDVVRRHGSSNFLMVVGEGRGSLPHTSHRPLEYLWTLDSEDSDVRVTVFGASRIVCPGRDGET